MSKEKTALHKVTVSLELTEVPDQLTRDRWWEVANRAASNCTVIAASIVEDGTAPARWEASLWIASADGSGVAETAKTVHAALREFGNGCKLPQSVLQRIPSAPLREDDDIVPVRVTSID